MVGLASAKMNTGGDRTAWLGREDSNSQMSFAKTPFDIWGEFPLISEHLGTRAFSRAGAPRVMCTFWLDWLAGWQNSNPGLSQ
jgi:hypothetical protein